MSDMGLVSIFACRQSTFPAPFVEEAVFLPMVVFDSIKNHMAVAV
jgi:hypothetical protein